MGMTKKEFDKMRFAARDTTQDVWNKARATHMESQTFHGDVLKEAASTAIEAAGKVMIEMGATPEMVDTMRENAYKDFIEAYDYAGGSSTLTPANYVIMTLAEMAPD